MIWGSLVALIIAPLGVFGQTVSGTAPAGGGCTFAAVGFTNPGPLTDLSVPNTLTLTETLFHTSCSQIITERVTVYIDGTTFSADPTVYTLSAAGQQFITYNFPFVTMTSLTANEELLFSWDMSVTTTDTLFPRSGQFTIYVPTQKVTSSPTSTPTSSSTSSVAIVTTTLPPNSGSSGLSSGAIGGIVGGVLGGLALIALAGIIFFYRRRKTRQVDRDRPDSFQYFGQQQPSQKPGFEIDGAGAGTSTEAMQEQQRQSLRYPEQDFSADGPVSGRTGGNY